MGRQSHLVASKAGPPGGLECWVPKEGRIIKRTLLGTVDPQPGGPRNRTVERRVPHQSNTADRPSTHRGKPHGNLPYIHPYRCAESTSSRALMIDDAVKGLSTCAIAWTGSNRSKIFVSQG